MIEEKQLIGGRQYSFGLDRNEVVARLERIADGIRSGVVIPQDVVTAVGSAAGQFEVTTLLLTYAEPRS